MILINILNKWLLYVFFKNYRLLIKYLKEIKCSYYDLLKATLIYNSINSGFTFTNPEFKTTIMFVSKASSRALWFNTIVHELKHVQSHVCKYYNIDEDSEKAAYLIGYLMQKLIKYI